MIKTSFKDKTEKQSRKRKYIQVPLFVFNLALLFACLLTVSQLLAWLTIARHQKTIELLSETLNHAQDNMENTENLEVDEENNIRKLFAVDENSETRERRHLDNNNSGYRGPKGQKGDKGDDGRTGRDGRDGLRGPQGMRGQRGDTGMRGPQGYVGPPGLQGASGNTGVKGEPGFHGSKGMKGDKGNDGKPGKIFKYRNSAHIVGMGKRIKSQSGNPVMSPKVLWKVKQKSGKMNYFNGRLTVGMDGVYFVYCQMFYYDGTSSYIGYEVYLDNTRILKAVHSIINRKRKYETQYTSGIFEISKGQKIYVQSPFSKYFYFNDTLSYFGAFMLHEKSSV